jgi:hypothetical protein
MAQHTAALTTEGNLAGRSRPSRPRGLNLVDERGRPIFEAQSSFGLLFTLGIIVSTVVFTALIVTGRIGQPALQASEPPLPLANTPRQVLMDESFHAEALDRARVTTARLSTPVTVTAASVSPATQVTTAVPETGAANPSQPKPNPEPASKPQAGDNPY